MAKNEESENVVSKEKEILEIQCSEPWFGHIRSEKKAVEGRKGSPAWSSIKVGSFIRFVNARDPGESFLAKVCGISVYVGPGALRDYLTAETLARTLPGVTAIEEGEKIYRQWWTQDEIEKYGVLGLTLEVVKD